MSVGIALLLFEDEPLISLCVQQALEDGGFKVEVAASGTEAMQVLERPDTPKAGLVTDVRLGSGANGWEVARRARELNPTMAVVYITGDSEREWPVEGVPKSIVLQKPFANAQLLTAVATLLNDAPTST